MILYLSFIIISTIVPDSACFSGISPLGTLSFTQIIAFEEPGEESAGEPVYPKLLGYKKDKCKQLLSEFKNRNPEKRVKAIQGMIALGRAVIPSLLENVDTTDVEQRECICSCLDKLTDSRDLKLYQDGSKSKTEAMRLLSVRKIADFRSPDFHDFLKEALKDKSAEVRIEAAIGLAWLKDPLGLGEIILKVAEHLKSPLPRLDAPLPQLKDEPLPNQVFKFLVHDEDPNIRSAAVATITQIGGTSVVHLLKKALDDSHHQVQRAAVNGLRKLIDNEEPRDFDTLFELVEEVNLWKNRLNTIKQEK